MKGKKTPCLKVLRVTLAVLFFIAIVLLLSGALASWAPRYLGWTARLQFVPAILALNAGAFVVVLLLTVLFGRIYCSVVCPLGILQDIVIFFRPKKKRYSYSRSRNVLRYGLLILFVALLVAGLTAIAGWIEPYSIFGRFVAAWRTDVPLTAATWPVVAVAAIFFIVIVLIANRFGRAWCNNVCPVGTILGLLSRFSLFKPVIDTQKCNGCGACGKGCKCSCIDTKKHSIDYSRCVVCMDCLGNCRQGAIRYRIDWPSKPSKKCDVSEAQPTEECKKAKSSSTDAGRRAFLMGSALAIGAAAVKAEETKMDGGLAEIIDKKVPARQTRITPPGSVSARNMYQHCTACQLCVSSCPNHVLRPSTDLAHFMQPEASYEKGYCRPECTVCSDVCPAGAIKPITVEEKASTQIGHAVWIKDNCVVLTDEVTCGNCARHCPTGAIQMVPVDGQPELEAQSPEDRRRGPREDHRRKIPVINEERCIGCGACENLCPSRPFSAIYVEGHIAHKTI